MTHTGVPVAISPDGALVHADAEGFPRVLRNLGLGSGRSAGCSFIALYDVRALRAHGGGPRSLIMPSMPRQALGAMHALRVHERLVANTAPE